MQQPRGTACKTDLQSPGWDPLPGNGPASLRSEAGPRSVAKRKYGIGKERLVGRGARADQSARTALAGERA